MTNNPITPVQPLIADARAYLRLGQAALAQHRSAPTDVALAMGACMFAFHLKDWRRPRDDADFFAKCPFAQTLGELTNGVKHLQLSDPRYTSDPHVKVIVAQPAMGPIGSAPIGALPIGGSSPAEIFVITRRFAADPDQRFNLDQVLSEALSWWDAALA